MRRPPPPVASVVAAAIAVTVLSVAAVSCGGGSETRLTRAEMVARADAICRAGLRDADQLRGADPAAHGDAAASVVDASIAVLNSQIDGFDDLRGPASTDAALDDAVRQLRVAVDGVEELRDIVEREDVTVNDAVEGNPGLVARINAATGRANRALQELGFLSCIGVTSPG